MDTTLFCALRAVKTLPLYRTIRKQYKTASPLPNEWWQEAGTIYLTFDLVAQPAALLAPFLLFAVDVVSMTLRFARLIVPDATAAQVTTTDLWMPGMKE